MATYKTYAGTEYEQAAAKLAQFLQEADIFDSVTLSTDTITCTHDGETAASFAFSSGACAYTFGPLSLSASSTTEFWVGKATNGVLIILKSGTVIQNHLISISKAQSGVPIAVVTTSPNASSAGSRKFYALTCDTVTAPAETTLWATADSDYYSTLAGISTTYAGDATIAATDKVFRYVDRQTNVPLRALSVISISGTDYLTDGFLAVQD